MEKREKKKPVHKVVMTESKRNIIRRLLQEYDIESAKDIRRRPQISAGRHHQGDDGKGQVRIPGRGRPVKNTLPCDDGYN